MKKMYIIILCLLTIVLTSCSKLENTRDMSNEVFYNKFIPDDTTDLTSILTKEYDLYELQAFFENSDINDNFDNESTTLLFSVVNQNYPIEVIRSGGYSVYRVSQGGYFYVFWVKPFIAEVNQLNVPDEPVVYFTAYLSFPIDPAKFDSLRPGISTAEDVKAVDPSFEVSFLVSNGIFSYSFLSDGIILQIEYTYQGEINGYDDLLVKEITAVPRNSVPSRYSTILSKDIL